jgi:ADP-heptose:LPS heptosyltransferase
MMDGRQFKTFVIFEPWGLGDLLITLQLAKGLFGKNIRVIVVCDARWAEWAKSLDFIAGVISFTPPWTSQERKYALTRYHLKDFLRFRCEILSARVDAICDMRGDIRNLLLLKILFPMTKFFHLCRMRFSNRYERPTAIFEKIFPGERLSTQPIFRRLSRCRRFDVICFFGGAWPNRCVPENKANEILFGLSQRGFKVAMIVPSEAGGEARLVNESSVTRVCGSLSEIFSYIQESAICLSTDSGWLHAGFACGLPTIGMFGFSNAEEWAPPGCRLIFSHSVLPEKDRYKLKLRNVEPLQNLVTNLVLDQCNIALMSFVTAASNERKTSPNM